MRLRKRMASNNTMTDEQIAESIIDNVVNNESGTISGLLIDPYFDMKEEDGKISFSGKFEHLETDENTIDDIGERLNRKIESFTKGNKAFEEKVKESIEVVISNTMHSYNDFVHHLNELKITYVDVYVTSKRYLQTYKDSAMVTFYIEMETV